MRTLSPINKLKMFLAVLFLIYVETCFGQDRGQFVCDAGFNVEHEQLSTKHFIVPAHHVCEIFVEEGFSFAPEILELGDDATLKVLPNRPPNGRYVVSIEAAKAYFGIGAIIDATGLDGTDGIDGSNHSAEQAPYCTDGLPGGAGTDGTNGGDGLSVFLNIQLMTSSKLPTVKTFGGRGGEAGQGGLGQKGGAKANDETLIKAADKLEKLFGKFNPNANELIDPEKKRCIDNNRAGTDGSKGQDGTRGMHGKNGSVWGVFKVHYDDLLDKHVSRTFVKQSENFLSEDFDILIKPTKTKIGYSLPFENSFIDLEFQIMESYP